MTPIPRAALLLTGFGALPFCAAALMSVMGWEVHYKSGDDILFSYGWVILSFMGGCLWGFAAKETAPRPLLLGLSVLPALWAFFVSDHSLWLMVLGFVGLLGLDAYFARLGLAPGWWMRLRIPVTLVVVLCLIAGAVT